MKEFFVMFEGTEIAGQQLAGSKQRAEHLFSQKTGRYTAKAFSYNEAWPTTVDDGIEERAAEERENQVNDDANNRFFGSD